MRMDKAYKDWLSGKKLGGDMNSIGSVAGLSEEEVRQLEAWEEKERPALLCFIRWAKGKKFKGIEAKLNAKMGFLSGYTLALKIHGLGETIDPNEEAKKRSPAIHSLDQPNAGDALGHL